VFVDKVWLLLTNFDRNWVEINEICSDDKAISLTLLKTSKYRGFVIVTGGLGPTKDDVTKKTFCDYLRTILRTESSGQVTKIIEGFYKRPITQINRTRLCSFKSCFYIQSGGDARDVDEKGKHRFISAAGSAV
jgi:nicotinamide-nucleotide amidase